jgi:hypothetical protein
MVDSTSLFSAENQKILFGLFDKNHLTGRTRLACARATRLAVAARQVFKALLRTSRQISARHRLLR